MSKFTPVPWTFDGDTYTIASETSLIIASVATVDDYSGLEEAYIPELAEQCAANGPLIAAAPDLYAALGLVLDALSGLYRERARNGHCSASEAARLFRNDGAVIAARAALRKARGEEV